MVRARAAKGFTPPRRQRWGAGGGLGLRRGGGLQTRVRTVNRQMIRTDPNKDPGRSIIDTGVWVAVRGARERTPLAPVKESEGWSACSATRYTPLFSPGLAHILTPGNKINGGKESRNGKTSCSRTSAGVSPLCSATNHRIFCLRPRRVRSGAARRKNRERTKINR